MTDLRVYPCREPLRGSVPAPPDRDLEDLARVLRGTLSPSSRPDAPIDCGDSAVLMAALCGLLVHKPFASTVTGEAEMVAGSMADVVKVLRGRGAVIEGTLDPARPTIVLPPIEIEPPPVPLASIDTSLGPGQTLAKLALLVSGLYADGPTVIAESDVGTTAFERTMLAMGARFTAAGPVLRLDPGELSPIAGEVAGDGELAAYLLAAGMVVNNSVVGVRGVAIAPGGVLDALRRHHVQVAITNRCERLGVPCGDVTVSGGGRATAETIMTDGPMRETVLALAASEETVVENVDAIASRFPRFVASLRALGAEIEVVTR